MLFRFCLYGFLKNQQYYDPFLILAFRQKGLSFAMIGVLIGFREICVNFLEVPTGAVADVMGRRRSMIVSFLAYICSFVVFSLCDRSWTLFAAMFLFAVGTTFRTGTHKAMIFDYLERQGRLDEKTAVYGRTRSWSKLGSAVSVVVAAALVFGTGDYSSVFLLCTVPYALNIVNFLGYPAYLDGPHTRKKQTKSGVCHGRTGRAEAGKRPSGVIRTLLSALSQSFRRRPLRRLLIESMGYEGLFRSSKDYLQPVLKTACLSLPIMLAVADYKRVAVLVGAVYFLLHLLGSFASRGAGRFAELCGGQQRSARVLWTTELLVFLLMAVGILVGLSPVVIVAFVLLAIFQNFWRPILISRVASHADPAQTATILSIESQAKSLFVAVVAPLIGWSVDQIAMHNQDLRFLPIAAVGVAVSALMLFTGSRRRLGRA